MHKSEINLGSVDCYNPVTRALCKTFKVGGYPTLDYFTDDLLNLEGPAKYYTFAETRTMEIIEKFALERGYMNSNWKHVPEDKDAQERTPKLEFNTKKEAIDESLEEDIIKEAIIEPL